MKVLITGGAGYIGSVLTRELLSTGYQVKILDRLFFGEETINDIHNPDLEVVRGDVRYCNPSILDDVDAVVDLAALSNDPVGELDPDKTWDINYLGRLRMAKLSEKKDVERYVPASSCSVYGDEKGIMNEESSINPLSTYAEAHRELEKEVLRFQNNDLCVTPLRLGTVYGISPRMRFDTAINAMVHEIYENKKIGVRRDGDHWRPFVHVKDVSKAFKKVLKSSKSRVNNEIFNIGSKNQNYKIKEVSNILIDTFDFEIDKEWFGEPDNRSYKVDFTKINTTLGYETGNNIQESAKRIHDKLESGEIEKSKKTITLDWYKHLMNNKEKKKDLSMNGSLL